MRGFQSRTGRTGLFRRAWTIGDTIALLFIVALLYVGARLALNVPRVIKGPSLSLDPVSLPLYAGLSLARMVIAYLLSLVFSIGYGYWAAANRRAEQILIPLLDILQSVPILSFLPVVLLGLSAFLPQGIAAELASIILIFTSQAWNLTFAWYQSRKTVPKDLGEAAANFQFDWWLRFTRLDAPFAAIGFVWNSIMSWAGGWFFLMAAEIFTVGKRDFRLPGLGAYLSAAADRGDSRAILWGLLTLISLIVALDQFLWRPLLAWADRFKLETVEGVRATDSWFYNVWHRSKMIAPVVRRAARLLIRSFDESLIGLGRNSEMKRRGVSQSRRWPMLTASAIFTIGTAYAVGRAAIWMMANVSAAQWTEIGIDVGATALRVLLAVALAVSWTVPMGVAIGTNARLASWLQPAAQIAASVPATAVFPVLLLVLVRFPGGLNIVAVLLMLLGTQWYLLFNVIAGATAIPQDLKHTTSLLGLNQRERWRVLILPALFPYIVTGLVTAGGGAWNASIVAEYTEFGGQTRYVPGIGSLIARATAAGNYPLLLAATLTMVLAVVIINRFGWRRLYNVAENRFRME